MRRVSAYFASTNIKAMAVSISDPKREFFVNLSGLLETLSIRFPDCQPTKLALEVAQSEQADEAKGDVRLLQWYLKMRSHIQDSSQRGDASIQKLSNFGLLEDCQLGARLPKLSADDQDVVWQFINNCNCMCVLYDKQSADSPFADITVFADRLMTLFPKEKIRESGYVEIMRHVPQLLSDDEMHALIAKLSARDDRMDRVFGLMELQFGSTIEPTQRDLMRATLKQAAEALGSDQARGVLSAVSSAIPDFLEAGRSALDQIFASNPDLKDLAGAVLESGAVAGAADGDPPSIDELESAAAEALRSLDSS